MGSPVPVVERIIGNGMKYTEYRIAGIPDAEAADVVVAELADLGFDSFSDYEEQEKTLCGYVPAGAEGGCRDEAEKYLKNAGYRWTATEIPDDTNWNALWESNFQPIEVENRCCIRAPFHEPRPNVEHEIVIMPKMSFGTGHHATTRLMLEALLDGDFRGKQGLDMGSGTGVLAILAVRLGALAVDAIDVDEWAYENCRENLAANGVPDRVPPLLGDASLLAGGAIYDFVLANINRNILLNDMQRYADVLRPGGTLWMSGFLEIDVPVIEAKAVSLGFSLREVRTKEGWALTGCVKNA